MKNRILFVDDEPQILDGLRNLLRKHRHKWDMTFVLSGKEALRELETAPSDVIVSDMRMPAMDGATLLKRVQEKHPHVVRIVLSGHAELETALRVVPVAHQFLTKPCDSGTLENVIERACNLQALINDDAVRRMVGKIDWLPSLPRVYSQIVAALADENVAMEDVAGILKQDMAIYTKILQIVNSAFFRLSRRIAKIEDAMTYLGFNTIKQLVLAIGVFQQGSAHRNLAGLSLEGLQEHGLFVGSLAYRLFKDKQQKEDAFTAGLLHDIGKLILATGLPDHIRKVAAAMHTEGGFMHAVEERLCGVTHAEVGGYLLGLWGLPCPIVEAVANHHAPTRVEQRGFDILAAVYVSNILANEQTAPVIKDIQHEETGLDPEYMQALGVANKMNGWREMAREQAQTLFSGLVARG